MTRGPHRFFKTTLESLLKPYCIIVTRNEPTIAWQLISLDFRHLLWFTTSMGPNLEGFGAGVDRCYLDQEERFWETSSWSSLSIRPLPFVAVECCWYPEDRLTVALSREQYFTRLIAAHSLMSHPWGRCDKADIKQSLSPHDICAPQWCSGVYAHSEVASPKAQSQGW